MDTETHLSVHDISTRGSYGYRGTVNTSRYVGTNLLLGTKYLLPQKVVHAKTKHVTQAFWPTQFPSMPMREARIRRSSSAAERSERNSRPLYRHVSSPQAPGEPVQAVKKTPGERHERIYSISPCRPPNPPPSWLRSRPSPRPSTASITTTTRG